MKSEKVYIEYLVLKAQAGEKLPAEQQVGDQLFFTLRPKIKAFVLKILGSHEAVDDCVQNTLLKVFGKLKQLKQVKAVHTWLYRIAYSSCMDHCRNQCSKTDTEAEAVADLSELDQQLDVKTAIANLAEAQQAIIFLFYYEGFTVAEMASILNQPAGTIKYQLFMAREQIKQQLIQTNLAESNHEY